MDFHPLTGVLYAVGVRGTAGLGPVVLLTIDLATGKGTEIKPITGTFCCPQIIAFRNSDGALFGLVSDALVHIDVTTGASTLIKANTSLAGFGLAMDFLGDFLYATDGEGALQTFNPANGEQIGSSLMCRPDFDCLGQFLVSSMSFQPGAGTVYGLMNQSCCHLTGLQLVTIDPFAAADPPRSTITIVGSVIDGLAALAWSPGDNVNTPVGANIAVQAAPATLTFEMVTQAGNTTVTASPDGPPLPTGFRHGTPPTYFDITTTAVFSGFVDVCIGYAGIAFGNEVALTLRHW